MNIKAMSNNYKELISLWIGQSCKRYMITYIKVFEKVVVSCLSVLLSGIAGNQLILSLTANNSKQSVNYKGVLLDMRYQLKNKEK